MAPELLQAGKAYSAKVDVYAFGVMLNEMLARSPPWWGMAAGDIRRQVSLTAGVIVGLQQELWAVELCFELRRHCELS
jgi:serine/threonine protein kinase